MIQTWLRSTIVYRSVSGMTFTCGKALRSVMYPVMGEYKVMFLIGSAGLQNLVDLRFAEIPQFQPPACCLKQ